MAEFENSMNCSCSQKGDISPSRDSVGCYYLLAFGSRKNGSWPGDKGSVGYLAPGIGDKNFNKGCWH